MDDAKDAGGRTERRTDRVPIRSEVSLRKRGYNPAKIELLDASPFGCKVEVMDRLASGEEVWLRLPGLEPIAATVAWTNEWTAGLKFEKALHPAVFDMLIGRLKPPTC